MRRMMGTAAAILMIASGCTDTTGPEDPQEPSESGGTAVIEIPEPVEGEGLCDALVVDPLQDLADVHGFAVDAEAENGRGCHGRLEFVSDDGPVPGLNGMSLSVHVDRFPTTARAASAFEARSDPESPDFTMALASGKVPPEAVGASAWDGFRIAEAAADAPEQELRAMLLKDGVIVNLWVRIDPTRSGTEACEPDGGGRPCAMTSSFAAQWLEADYATALADVLPAWTE